jgi:hypothetical protein
MTRLFRSLAAVAAAVLGIGVLAVAPMGTESPQADAKREESLNVVLTADDDDHDDDTDDDTSVNDDASGISRDGTNSRFTAVSRDRDRSRGDLTKDRTWDGGDRTRDFSQNRTNDSSRNDSR